MRTPSTPCRCFYVMIVLLLQTHFVFLYEPVLNSTRTLYCESGPSAWEGWVFLQPLGPHDRRDHPRGTTVGTTPKYRGVPSGTRIWRAIRCRHFFSSSIQTAHCCTSKSCNTGVDKNTERFKASCCAFVDTTSASPLAILRLFFVHVSFIFCSFFVHFSFIFRPFVVHFSSI